MPGDVRWIEVEGYQDGRGNKGDNEQWAENNKEGNEKKEAGGYDKEPIEDERRILAAAIVFGPIIASQMSADRIRQFVEPNGVQSKARCKGKFSFLSAVSERIDDELPQYQHHHQEERYSQTKSPSTE